MKRSKYGFTLVEIITVVAIVGILTAIALPAYGRYVLRSQRVEAKVLLNEIAQRQERFFSTYNVYSSSATGTGTAGLGMVANCSGVVGSENCLYSVRISAINAGLEYQLRAIPQDKQADDECGDLRLTGRGVKTFDGNESNGACW